MANFNYNKVILGGRLTEDPKLETTPSGIPVATFHIAVNRRQGGETTADFFSVIVWRKLAEFVTTYFHKASSICVTGYLQTRSWVDQAGGKHYATNVVAEDVCFVDAKSEMPEFRQPRETQETQETGETQDGNEEMPF